MFIDRGQFVYRSLSGRFWLQGWHRLSGITQTKNQITMKTNAPIVRHCFSAALLLTLAGCLSACESTPPVNPEPVIIQPLPNIVFDTLMVRPYEPETTPIKPIHDPEPAQL